MDHYVHQLVANWVCLLFGAEQVVYSRFLELFYWKKLLAAAENDTDESSESRRAKTMSSDYRVWW